MTRYVIALLFVFALLAGLLLYIGDDTKLVLSSSAESGVLAFNVIELTWQAVILIGTALLAAIIGIWSLFGWLWRLPRRVKSGVGLRRRDQALDAMEEALIAGAEGDSSKARKKSEKARSLISSPDLGRMISAQTAQASGDSGEAISQYTAMLDSSRTQAIGQRGLAQLLLENGNLNGAIEHASKAYGENKNARWAFDVLFQAQVSDHQWGAAHESLGLGEKRKHVERDIARRRAAVLQTAQADALADSGQTDKALDIAVGTAQSVPEFAPAVALAAKLLAGKGEVKKAAQLIEKAWAKAPHPALSLAYRDLLSSENPKARAKQLRALYKANPGHRETVILQAEEAMLAGDGVSAWSALSPFVSGSDVSARICILASKAEAMLKNMQDSRIWLERAATAPAEPDWSDLDPSGEAFDYNNQDWRRLVFTFGKDGELIHPRFESGAVRRAVLSDVKAKTAPATPKADEEISSAEKTDDLAERFDNLLDKPE